MKYHESWGFYIVPLIGSNGVETQRGYSTFEAEQNISWKMSRIYICFRINIYLAQNLYKLFIDESKFQFLIDAIQ